MLNFLTLWFHFVFMLFFPRRKFKQRCAESAGGKTNSKRLHGEHVSPDRPDHPSSRLYSGPLFTGGGAAREIDGAAQKSVYALSQRGGRMGKRLLRRRRRNE